MIDALTSSAASYAESSASFILATSLLFLWIVLTEYVLPSKQKTSMFMKIHTTVCALIVIASWYSISTFKELNTIRIISIHITLFLSFYLTSFVFFRIRNVKID